MKFIDNQGKSITNYKVRQTEERQTPPDMPKIHYLCGIYGSRGTGKSTSLLNLIKSYESTRSFDKIYLFSPTMTNEPKYKIIEDGKYDLITYDNFSNELFSEVTEEIDSDINAYKEYKKEMKIYCDWKNGKSIQSMGMGLINLSQRNFEPPERPRYFKQMPSSLIIFDDMFGNKDLYSSNAKNPVSRFAILHRHKLSSIIYCLQGFKNGLPLQIRNNLSLLILFANKNVKMKEEIADEFLGSFVTRQQFIEMWDKATEIPHNFFCCDFDEKDKNKKFRQNFDKFIQID